MCCILLGKHSGARWGMLLAAIIINHLLPSWKQSLCFVPLERNLKSLANTSYISSLQFLYSSTCCFLFVLTNSDFLTITWSLLPLNLLEVSPSPLINYLLLYMQNAKSLSVVLIGVTKLREELTSHLNRQSITCIRKKMLPSSNSSHLKLPGKRFKFIQFFFKA